LAKEISFTREFKPVIIAGPDLRNTNLTGRCSTRLLQRATAPFTGPEGIKEGTNMKTVAFLIMVLLQFSCRKFDRFSM